MLISFDTETHLIQPGLLAPPIVCGSFARLVEEQFEEDGEVFTQLESDVVNGADNVCEFIATTFGSGDTICGANISYDLACVAVARPDLLPLIFKAYDEGRVYDVLIGAALDALHDGNLGIDPRTHGALKSPSTGKIKDRYSLEIVTDLYLNRRDAKANDFWRLRYAILERVPFERWPAEAIRYCKDDARNTLEVARYLLKHGKNQHNQSAQAKAAFALQLASIRGLRTEPEAIATLEKEILGDIEAVQKKFIECGFLKVDENEIKQDQRVVKAAVARAFGVSGICPTCNGSGKVKSEKSKNDIICKGAKGCDGTGLNLATSSSLPRTDSGGISADRDTLKECGDELLESYAGISELHKIRDTYLPYLHKGTEYPITPSANVLLATGRTSYDGLIQLMSKRPGVRDSFVFRPGYYGCSVDYSALELCTLAQCQLWICGSSRLAEVLNTGLDPHSWLAAQMLGVTYEEFIKRKKAGDKQATTYRSAAKNCNFGLPGGMGVPKFIMLARRGGMRFCKTIGGAEVCGKTKVTSWNRRDIPPTCERCLEIANDLKNAWFSSWPEMKRYFDFIAHHVDASGSLVQFLSERVRGGLDFCSGANTLFQGLAADGAKHALYNVTKECFLDKNSALFGARPLIFVHDEIISELPIEKADKAARRKAEIMIASMREYVPDVRIAAEPALMTRWLKAAEPMYNERGELIPWVELKK